MGLLHGRLQRYKLQKTKLTKPIQTGVGVWSKDYLQITNIDVLQGADCLTMCKKSPLVPHPQVLVRGINSTKVMDLDKQVDLDSNSFSEKCSLVCSLLSYHFPFNPQFTFTSFSIVRLLSFALASRSERNPLPSSSPTPGSVQT